MMQAVSARRPSWPIVILLHAAGFALSVVVFYPGVMNYDARYIYLDTAAGRFGDWQSPLMGWLWSVVDPIAPGPASILLVIAASYWLGFALLSVAVARRSRVLTLVTPLLALSPPAFAFVGMIWRDVLFACAWLLAAALAFAAAESRRPVRALARATALGLLGFGVLLRPNAILAAPILAVYLIWPQRFVLRHAVLLYLPTAVVLFALIQVVYYGIFDAMRQRPWHSVVVFDLGGITHFTKQNQFPVSWNARETALLTQSCYRPAPWNVYWNAEPCRFVMDRLEGEKIFGSPALVDAWMRAVTANPLAYLRHRAAFMWTFLAESNLTIWTQDLDDRSKPALPHNRAFMVLRSVHDALQPTPLFWPGTWLLLDAGLCAWAWRKRQTRAGAFAVAVCGSAVAYVLTFFAVGVAAEFRYAYWAVLAGLTGAVGAATVRRSEFETALVRPLPPDRADI
jgi:hypothetical protein